MKPLLILSGFICSISYGQDVFNLYLNENFHNKPISNATYSPMLPSGYEWNSIYLHNDVHPSSGNFSGEYEINTNKLYWQKFFPGHAITYNIETVSYPFIPECNITVPNCAGNSNNQRRLIMPPYAYDIAMSSWITNIGNDMIGISNVTPTGEFDAVGRSFFSQLFPIHNPKINTVMLSKLFTSTGNVSWQERILLAHTIHKINIRVHCTTSASPVIAQLSFIQDNTRGRMRFYPFRNSNTASGVGEHDLLFVPELLFDNTSPSHFYNAQSNTYMFPGNGTIDYAGGCNPKPWLCPSYNSPACLDEFSFTINGVSSIYHLEPPPYSTLTSSLRNVRGLFYAGYDIDNGTFPPSVFALPGLEHSYDINQNIDLSILNSNEKIIYNPYFTTVTASNLVFPSKYDFRTIRGVYPLKDQL